MFKFNLEFWKIFFITPSTNEVCRACPASRSEPLLKFRRNSGLFPYLPPTLFEVGAHKWALESSQGPIRAERVRPPTIEATDRPHRVPLRQTRGDGITYPIHVAFPTGARGGFISFLTP